MSFCRHIRKAGGLCIIDEIQTGFGRAGDYFWVFESQGKATAIATHTHTHTHTHKNSL